MDRLIPYILVLRGINVGGKRRLLMVDLKAQLSGFNFQDIQTYIQSGNVVFKSSIELNISKTEKRIAEMILKEFGLEVPVILFSSDKLRRIVQENPFVASAGVEQLYCTFVKNTPTKAAIDSLSEVSFAPDVFKVTNEVIYLKLQGKASDSKITNVFFEKKLGQTCTTRNWKTTLKLLGMVSSEN
ncbi:MAG: DUF1697 domain-containing protein [Crocinitomicaceae bacterium]